MLPLRTLARFAAALLTVVVIVSFVMLHVLTVRGRTGLQAREDAAEHIRSAESLRTALLRFGVRSDLAYLTKTGANELERMESEAAVLGGLARERSRPMDVEEERAFKDAEAKIKVYLPARRNAEATGPSIQEVLLASSPQLDDALTATARMVDIASNRLARAEAGARSRLYERELVGSIATALLLLAFGGGLIGLRWLVIEPLLRIADAIRGIAGGDRLARATERGPAEVRATAHLINQMAEQLVLQEKERLAFLAGVAHDMRNPLAAMRMSTHFLRPDVPLPHEAKVRETLALVDRQLTRLDRMVADFLDASRIESGHLELRRERQDARSLAKEAVELYAASSYSHVLTLRSADEEVAVYSDATRIGQVLNNLISNAIKYSPAGSPIEVTVTEDDGFATIGVADRGLGIPRGELDQIFEPFHRTGVSRETAPGVGLGLWVSRRIVEAHGGSLEVSSQVGVGSTFRVRLPLAPGEASSPAR